MNDLTRYKAYRPRMGTFDYISFSGHGGVSTPIKFITGQNKSHGGALLKFTWPSWLAIAEADPEVMAIDLENKIAGYDGEIYWHPLKRDFRHLRNKLGKKMMKYTGIKYDYWGVFKEFLKRVPVVRRFVNNTPDAKKMFCFEMVYLAGAFLELTPLPVPDKFVNRIPIGSEMSELGWWDEGIRIV